MVGGNTRMDTASLENIYFLDKLFPALKRVGATGVHLGAVQRNMSQDVS